ncbi:hypothetical protein G5714_002590 [Onychostoma macrolepis]|uniref:Uncharacterized protein n=1 Tax=Onychostoma macrolepis TaxID=369639 RepID=A0A7J6D7E6_9TELE|nr:hypothetical protein G5714_002590 [Onychostoma macrolepis]
MAQSRGKKMVELALKRKYPENDTHVGIPSKRQQVLPPTEEMEWTILDTLLDTTSVDSLYDDITDLGYVPTPMMTQTEVELGDPGEQVQEPEPQPEPQPDVESRRPPMREPCGAKCRRRFTPVPTKRITTGPESRRGRSFIYRLQNQKGEPRQVCKMFFLSSLGYHPKNDSLVISMMGKSNSRPLVLSKDQRGKQAAVNKMDVKTLDDHIESFHPCNRGVEEVKKRDIICNLCPLMPPNRRVFWYSLPVSNVVEDEE